MEARNHRTLLLLSLAFNLFLVCAIAGGAWRWWSLNHSQAQAAAQQRGLRFAADGLTSAERQAFRRGLRDARRESAPLISAASEGRREAARLMAAPEFDRAALDAALARTREADFALRTRLEKQVADFAATLSPRSREALTQGLTSRGPLRDSAAPASPGASSPTYPSSTARSTP